MENIIKYICGGVAAVLSFFAPISELVLCAVTFVGIDLLTGLWAGYVRASHAGQTWRLESAKAWRTVVKLVFVLGGIVLAWLVDSYILAFMDLKLANLFTGFVCGVEFWSYMENASDISGHPLFDKVKEFLRKRLGSLFAGSKSSSGEMVDDLFEFFTKENDNENERKEDAPERPEEQ